MPYLTETWLPGVKVRNHLHRSSSVRRLSAVVFMSSFDIAGVMEQLIESLVLGGLSKEKIDRARRRGIAYECLWCFKEGRKTVNIKCRMEEHVGKTHLKKDQAAFQCLLCGFVGLKREPLLAHVANNTKHVLLAAKFKILNHRPYLWENPSPYALGAEDYRAYGPEASLLHFLGILNQGSTTTETYPATGVATTDLDTAESQLIQPMTMCQPAVSETVTVSTVCTVGVESPMIAAPSSQMATQAMTSPLVTQAVVPSVVDQPVCQDLWRPYATDDSAEHSELGLTNIADQLLTMWQAVPGPSHNPTFGPVHLSLPEVSDKEENAQIESNEDSNKLNLNGDGDEQNSSEVIELEHTDQGDDKASEKLESEEKTPGTAESNTNKDVRTDSKTEKEHAGNEIYEQGDDVLELTDEDMTLSTPVKRAREEESDVPKCNAKKVREELNVDVSDLSERTLVNLEDRAVKMAQRRSVLSEESTKAIVDNTVVLAKLASAVTSLKTTIENHDREERRREERRREMDARREDEWRRALWRLRDEERRWEERRREFERTDREVRRKEGKELKERDENRMEDQKENSRGKENTEAPIRSSLGRHFTKDKMIDHSKYRK